MNYNLTNTQNDYAYFLPAISGFYSTFIGKQRFEEYVDETRIPKDYTNSVESLNYLNKQKDGSSFLKNTSGPITGLTLKSGGRVRKLINVMQIESLGKLIGVKQCSNFKD